MCTIPVAPGPRSMPTTRKTAPAGTRALRATRLEAIPNRSIAPMVYSRCLATSIDVGCKALLPRTRYFRVILLARLAPVGPRFVVVDQFPALLAIFERLGLAFTGSWGYDSRALASKPWRADAGTKHPFGPFTKRHTGANKNKNPRQTTLPLEDSMSTKQSNKTETASHRKCLAAAAAATAGAATLGFPMIAKGQAGPISMRWQSTWPSKDIFHEYALDFAKKVNDMTGGDLKIEVLPAGAVVPAFGLLDAVSKGTLDGGHGVLVYHYGKQTALALWGSGPGYGMDANMLLSWHRYGGGKELLAKLYTSIGANVVSFPYGPMYTQPLGWFKKPVTKADDFKGLKYRTVGISIDVFTGMGAAVNALPGGEIVSAIDRGLLDAAEFNNASSDKALGFADVSKICMLQSYHQNAEQFEVMFNKTKYDALPEKMKAIIENAVEAASQDMSWKAIDRYSKD